MKAQSSFGYKDAGATMLFGFLAIQALGFVLAFAGQAFGTDVTDDLVLTGLVTNAALLAAYFVYARYRRLRPLAAARVTTPFRWWTVPLALALVPVLQYAVYPLLALWDKAFAALGYVSRNTIVNTDFAGAPAWRYVLYALVTCLLTAFAEELVFRGAVLGGLRARFGDVASVVLCGTAFMLFHTSPDQTLFQFAFGCLLALLTLRSGSIVPAMAAHACNNGLSVLFSAIGFEWPLPTALGPLIALGIVGPLAAAVLLPLVVDAACGRTREWWVLRLIRGMRRGAEREQPIAEPAQPVDATVGDRLAAARTAAVARADRLTGSLTFGLACGLCALLWVSALVLGFVH